MPLATALTAAARAAGPRTCAYVMLSLCTGVRTEEARALRWEHVDFGDPASLPLRPASVAVWRSGRARGDTKTRKSRRTLGLPKLAATALQALHEKAAPGSEDLVFSTAAGQALDLANVRRSFRAVTTAPGIGPDWTPRELRHTFVSLMSDSNVAVEEIARLVGLASSKVTETVYRHQPPMPMPMPMPTCPRPPTTATACAPSALSLRPVDLPLARHTSGTPSLRCRSCSSTEIMPT